MDNYLGFECKGLEEVGVYGPSAATTDKYITNFQLSIPFAAYWVIQSVLCISFTTTILMHFESALLETCLADDPNCQRYITCDTVMII